MDVIDNLSFFENQQGDFILANRFSLFSHFVQDLVFNSSNDSVFIVYISFDKAMIYELINRTVFQLFQEIFLNEINLVFLTNDLQFFIGTGWASVNLYQNQGTHFSSIFFETGSQFYLSDDQQYLLIFHFIFHQASLYTLNGSGNITTLELTQKQGFDRHLSRLAISENS